MKKLLALMMALVMMLSFVACGEEEVVQEPAVDTPVIKELVKANNPALEAYLAENKDAFLGAMIDSFSKSAGTTCEGFVEVDGDGFVIDIHIDGFNDIPDDVKTALQEAYDTMGTSFDDALAQMQTELPELKSFTVNVCEEDGDLLAVIKAGE